MSQHSKALAILVLGFAIAVSGLVAVRQVIAVTGEADTDRLHRAILAYVAEKNPQAPIRAFQKFPEILLLEAQRTNIDHCLALAQAEVESEFKHDAVGGAGEIGIFQVLPSTAAIFEPSLGKLRRPAPAPAKGQRDLGDLADPNTATRFAMAYLRDILSRKPSIKDALTEYNGGPAGRHPHYYRMVMGTYVEVLERPELRCRFQAAPKQPAVTALSM
ncbi:MAG: lytic transglycosylase domain-containing protein [Candidatus Rokubacteria bacterium]|nr:lytic transglycosylase domain-containing protein [Candidatus Rokubacteria bacterium]